MYNFGNNWYSNQRVYTVNRTPFEAIRQELAYHVKYLRISWTYLDLLYRFGSHIGGDDYPDIHLALPKGCCYGNQLNLGDVHRCCAERPVLFALAFDNRLANCQATFKMLNGNNPATSCTNLVNFRPIISEIPLLKRASWWHWKTDWMITILISAK